MSWWLIINKRGYMEDKEYLALLEKIDSVQNHIENSTIYSRGFADLNKQLGHFYRVVNRERMESNVFEERIVEL